jgi:hypothetical protein
MARYLNRDGAAIAAALAAPLVVVAVLLPFRASWSNTNVALLLMVAGGRGRSPREPRRRRAGGSVGRRVV